MSASVQVFRKALSTNSTASAFVAKLATTTAPTTSATAGVYDLLDASLGLHSGVRGLSKFVQILPYAVGANNDTFDMRLWGWSKTNDSTPIYLPQLLIELNVIVGNTTAGNSLSSCPATAIAANTLLADTLTIAKGDTNSSYISPTGDQPGSILVHLRGCQYIEFDFDLTSSPTGVNAYWRVVDQS